MIGAKLTAYKYFYSLKHNSFKKIWAVANYGIFRIKGALNYLKCQKTEGAPYPQVCHIYGSSDTFFSSRFD